MQTQRMAAEQLRMSIYSEMHNPQHKKFILDRISDRIGQQHLAYIMMVLANLFFPLGFIYTNQNNFNPIQTLLLRGLVTIVINYLIVRTYGIEIDYSDGHNLKFLTIRNTIMTLQGLVYIVVQFYLPQPIIQTLNSAGTLFIFFLDYVINGITITQKQFYGVVFGVVGVLFTVNGEFIMKLFQPEYTTTTQFKHYASDTPMAKVFAALAFLSIQFIWAYGVIITKRLKHVNSIQINFHLGIALSMVGALLYPTQVLQPIDFTIFFKSIFYSGFLMVAGQICFIGAVTMTQNTGIITMLGFVAVIVGYSVSIIKYQEQINPFCIIGAVLILFGLAKIVLKPKSTNDIQLQKLPQKV